MRTLFFPFAQPTDDFCPACRRPVRIGTGVSGAKVKAEGIFNTGERKVIPLRRKVAAFGSQFFCDAFQGDALPGESP